MKKLLLSVVSLFALCCGCNDDGGEKPVEETLADSVTTTGRMEGEWSFDGVQSELTGENSFIDIRPHIDTYVILFCGIIIPNQNRLLFEYSITTGIFLLSGEPGNVTFDHPTYISLSERFGETADLVHDETSATIKGWIKRDNAFFTRLSPPIPPSYDCDIDIECEVDGKPLKLHITRINNYYK